ncbi:hypothetical protein LBLM1_10885 (plasmid) [Limosilactobacillus mucosae LM1]|uniref:Uncharacterized protein n=1 Tax=Limosilactobacillus mucosae LM1 TaxID=1130798 RepID=A0A0D4CNT2_LIMMU|nr:hypothetical protein [Limosilactobacillus mucosae]AJT51536.1 hypothetical protein LBLM1_10885 [Limosilactobacillus mucosae LM1]
MLSTGQSIVVALVIVGTFAMLFYVPMIMKSMSDPTRGLNQEKVHEFDEKAQDFLDGYQKRLDYSNIILADTAIYFRPDMRRDAYGVFPYNEIVDYHIAYQPTTTTRSGAGGAVVGGLLFGVVGAIAGGLATRRQLNSIKELTLVVHVKNLPAFKINFIDGERTESIIKNRITEYEQLRAYLDNHGVPYTQEVLPSLP